VSLISLFFLFLSWLTYISSLGVVVGTTGILTSRYKPNELVRVLIQPGYSNQEWIRHRGVYSPTNLTNTLHQGQHSLLLLLFLQHLTHGSLSEWVAVEKKTPVGHEEPAKSIETEHPVVVPFALAGEEVIARIARVFPTHTVAQIVSVEKAAPERTEPKCKYYGSCTGCQLQHVKYSTQLEMKDEIIRKLFRFVKEGEEDGEDGRVFRAIVASPQSYEYRTKITPHFQVQRKTRQMGAIGFNSLAGGNVDIEECPLATPAINSTLKDLRKNILDSKGTYSKGVSLILRESMDKLSEAVTVQTNHKAPCYEIVQGIEFVFSAGQFFQVNRSILSLVTSYVREELLRDGRVKNLLDCYCGSGLFLLTASSHFEAAFGVEVNADSVKRLEEVVKKNELTNVRVFLGDSAEIFSQLPNSVDPGRTGVVLDPSRDGCSTTFLDQLLDFAPRQVVYMACDPATQARDVRYLLSSGKYRVTRVQPFDFFPQTHHIENAVTLQLVSPAGEPTIV